MYHYLDRLRRLLKEVEGIEVKDDCENAEAIKALKSIVYDVAECLGDYINEEYQSVR